MSSLQLIKRLGAGAYGVVHLASFDAIKDPIVVKFFENDEYTGTNEISALYLIHKSVPHLRVPKPYFAFVPPERDHTVAILMSYVPGKHFAKAIQEANDIPRIFDLGEQLLSQVALLHERGMQHGDLHGENVMVCPTEDNGQEVVLIDVSFSNRGGSYHDTYRLLYVIDTEIIPRIRTLHPELAATLTRWHEEMEGWHSNSSMTAHHILYAWKHAVPHWLTQMQEQSHQVPLS